MYGPYTREKDCQWLVEFVSPPVTVGNESIQIFNTVTTSLGKIKLLLPVDSVKDRLASFFHWNDKQGLEQAINICLEQDIDMKEVERWSLKEKQEGKFRKFVELLEKRRQQK